MERMPKAWESHLSYFSNEFQVCDPRRSNRKCVCVMCAYANEELNLLNGRSSGAGLSCVLGKMSSQKHS